MRTEEDIVTVRYLDVCGNGGNGERGAKVTSQCPHVQLMVVAMRDAELTTTARRERGLGSNMQDGRDGKRENSHMLWCHLLTMLEKARQLGDTSTRFQVRTANGAPLGLGDVTIVERINELTEPAVV